MTRWFAVATLAILVGGGLFASFIAPYGYEVQTREMPNMSPSRAFPLGTDDLGRDRYSRLLYGTRVSLLVAPLSAGVATLLALTIGATAALGGKWADRLSMFGTDLFLAVPAFLILLTVRAMLPLNVSPVTSVMVTCALLGAFGWPSAARVVRAGMVSLAGSDFLLQARAAGQPRWRVFARHMLPNVLPLLRTQFWTLIPVFILSEANLSVLGLGVSEPVPSWGNMLRELENYSAVMERPWVLAPLAALMMTILSLYLILPAGEES